MLVVGVRAGGEVVFRSLDREARRVDWIRWKGR